MALVAEVVVVVVAAVQATLKIDQVLILAQVGLVELAIQAVILQLWSSQVILS